MMQRPRRHAGDGIFTGLLFMALGVIFLIGNLGMIQVRALFVDWWPLVLVLIGVKHLVLRRGRLAWLGAGFWIGTGVLFLGRTLGYLDIELPRLIWPLLLIWFGVLIVLGSNGHRDSAFNGRSQP